MVASITSKFFNNFAYAVDKATHTVDKITSYAKASFSSIKEIRHVPSKTVNFIKENKFTTGLAALSLAISAVVFVNVSATMAILFLGAISFVKAFAYTKAYVKSVDYQFKKLAKDYIRSIENVCKNFKNGKQLTNDVVTGRINDKFFNLQKSLIDFIRDNGENTERKNKWKKYLNNLNPSLRLNSHSFPRFSIWEKINTTAFAENTSISIEGYINILFDHPKASFKRELNDLIKEYDPISDTFEEDVLSKSKTIKSDLKDETKRALALKLAGNLKEFYTDLKDLVKEYDPSRDTFKEDVLSKSKTIKSDLKDETKRDLALKLAGNLKEFYTDLKDLVKEYDPISDTFEEDVLSKSKIIKSDLRDSTKKLIFFKLWGKMLKTNRKNLLQNALLQSVHNFFVNIRGKLSKKYI